ncbi:IS630 family transposase [Moorena sp. SIO3H5]|uniref:IS630 family transposase n=1 Tax=Moorena sp. SIO3H5 TaxID=2607834 RepID=UPI0013B8D29F|nr:IS630 family transposase [Moorena sp. SIO3H5]NEO69710.1 IS630 family transposase [Moorena sp. SIO3H5]
MPKKAYLADHLSNGELKKRYRASLDPVEARRWHLLWKISLGWTIKNAAAAVGINYQYAFKILKKYNELGEEGVQNLKKKSVKHPRGKKPLLTEKQFQELTVQLKKRPPDGGIWTGPKVARWIETITGIEKVWNQRGWDYLKKSKYSWQKPRPKHRKGDPIEQKKFKDNFPLTVQQLRTQFSDAQIEVWFFDEHRVGLKPIIKKIWAPIGERPTAVVHHRYEWLYVYGFVEPKTGKTLCYLIPRVNNQWLSLVYQAFAEDVGVNPEKIIILVEDNAGWHRSQKVKIPEGIIVKFLPPYSPELQPAERLWSLIDEPLVNESFKTIDEIEERLVTRCQLLHTMTSEIKNLTNYHWLTYD